MFVASMIIFLVTCSVIVFFNVFVFNLIDDPKEKMACRVISFIFILPLMFFVFYAYTYEPSDKVTTTNNSVTVIVDGKEVKVIDGFIRLETLTDRE